MQNPTGPSLIRLVYAIGPSLDEKSYQDSVRENPRKPLPSHSFRPSDEPTFSKNPLSANFDPKFKNQPVAVKLLPFRSNTGTRSEVSKNDCGFRV